MSDDDTAPYAIWFLRVALAIALFAHLEMNLIGFEPQSAAHWLGLPLGVSPVAMVLESVIAVALIFGIWPRAAAFVGAVTVLGAIVKVRGPAVFTNSGFDWTGPAIWIGALILLALLGDGALVLVPSDPKSPKENQS